MKPSYIMTQYTPVKTQAMACKSKEILALPITKLAQNTLHFLFQKAGRNCLSLLVVFIIAPCWVFGQTTWTGAVSVRWDDPDNWTAGVPDVDDDVIIPNTENDPVVYSGNATAKSIHIVNLARLSVARSVSLHINGSSTQGLLNDGWLINYGHIRIDLKGSVGSYGIKNTGYIRNESNISIDGVSNYAIWHSGPAFENLGTIDIYSGSKGIYNEAFFYHRQGTLNINGTSLYGIENAAGTFTSEAFINIGESSPVGTAGIKNSATFNHNATIRINGGAFSIGGVTTYGIWNNSGTFENQGSLQIYSGSRGIYNEATFNHNQLGNLNINGTSLYGIENAAGTFTNLGFIHIGAFSPVGTSGVKNSAIFNNTATMRINGSTSSGLLNSAGKFSNNILGILGIGLDAPVGVNGIVNSSSAQFLNSYLIFVNGATTLGIDNQGDFANVAEIDISRIIFNNTYSSNGIKNTGDFKNQGGGKIRIPQLTAYGVWNSAGTFTNEAMLEIGGTNVVGTKGIYNQAIFNNNPGGLINSIKASVYGIENAAGTFTNAATINIGNEDASSTAGTHGLRNSATFNNNANGLLNIGRPTEVGLWNNTGVFSNSGAINIGSPSALVPRGFYNETAFNNNSGGVININYTSLYGIDHIKGTFTNAAAINIGSTSSVGTSGLRNAAIFNNSGSGQISIDQVTDNGIWNSSGTFTNAAGITIGSNAASSMIYGIQSAATFNNNSSGLIKIDRSTSAGLWNRTGTFTNASTLSIGSSHGIGTHGLRNAATFNNTAGQITIDRSSETGLWNNGGTFNNASILSIGSVATVGARCIYSDGSNAFNNNTGGVINANNASLYGIELNSGTFTNRATIHIGSLSAVGTYGLRNNAAFNNTSGQINIDRSSSFGLRNNSGTFTNAATINIGSLAAVGTTGISNAATINNNNGGTINIDRVTTRGINNVSGTIANQGNIIIGGLAVSSILYGLENDAVFTNSGGGQIKIDRSTSVGFWNSAGTFNNAATLSIGSVANAGAKCIYNENNFNNNSGGIINANNASQIGIDNLAGVFTNAATINIGSLAGVGTTGITNTATLSNNGGGTINIDRVTTRGISNVTGTIENQGSITIGGLNASSILYGVENGAAITNSGGGHIKIDRSTSLGFWNNAGTFNNAASLSIGSAAAIGDKGIYNNASGTFNNNAGGTINVNNASLYGIEHLSGTFTNQATINIGSLASAGTYGLRNSGNFNNSAGVIKIDRCTSFGLRNNSGTFNNAATLTIGSLAGIGTTGISNAAIINNNAGGSIDIDRATTQGINNVTGTFTNNASIEIGKITPIRTLFTGAGGEFSNAAGGTFKGTGAINATYFTNAGGTLSPGYSPGSHTFSAGEDFGNSTLVMEVNGAGGADFDQIIVNGTANLSNTSTYLQLVFSYAVEYGTTFDLITATSITGTIAEGNISFTNIGAGNVTGFTVSYPSANKLRVTINSPLPVSLISFDARAEGATRQLDWETSMELDNDYFEIQRSEDAKNFSAIGQVRGSNTGIKTNHYNYTDSETIPAGGIIYYRLKMVDLDGSYAYSRIQSVHTDQILNAKFFPNPVSAYLTIEAADWENVKKIRLYDVNGRTVYDSEFSGLSRSIDVKSKPEGTYIIELKYNRGQIITSRIMIRK